ncbi:hypothetical protein [Candidatus Rickettsia kedanie]|uniref:Uncharacterized protein n=1 Tax=Candidatus Rickettsia kedanie TaxID=3115352 RepID=A0ABP9TWM7_9RICK
MIIDEEDFDEMTIGEDIAFSKLADKRLKETKYWIKHEDAWIFLALLVSIVVWIHSRH